MNETQIAIVLNRIQVTCQKGVGVNKISDLKKGDLLLLTSFADESKSTKRIFLILQPVDQETLKLSGQFLDSKLDKDKEHNDSAYLGNIAHINLLAREADRAFLHLRQLFKDKEYLMKRLARIENRFKEFEKQLLQ